MNEAAAQRRDKTDPGLWFRIFKYTIYVLLAWNVFLFFQDDMAAARETFGNTVTWRNLAEAYSATVDTAAWVVLLLLFELETAVIPDEKLRGGLKWLLMGIRSVSYAFILWAFWGYIAKYIVLTDLVPFRIEDVCSLIGTDYTWVADLDDYYPVDAESCAALGGRELFQVAGTHIIGTAEAIAAAVRLAAVDVINAGTWLVIVALLEVEVLLQVWRKMKERLMRAIKYTLFFLYAILFGAAAYWGVKGDFIDFWDAVLWLVAFIFIELNITKWHAEVKEEQHERARQAAERLGRV